MWLIFLSFQLRMETHVYHSPCTTLTPLADLIRINRLGSVFCWIFLGNISQLIGFNTRQYLGLAKFCSFMTLIGDFLHGVLEQGLKVMYHIVFTWILLQMTVRWASCLLRYLLTMLNIFLCYILFSTFTTIYRNTVGRFRYSIFVRCSYGIAKSCGALAILLNMRTNWATYELYYWQHSHCLYWCYVYLFT